VADNEDEKEVGMVLEDGGEMLEKKSPNEASSGNAVEVLGTILDVRLDTTKRT
jgi:hypothetical protein